MPDGGAVGSLGRFQGAAAGARRRARCHIPGIFDSLDGSFFPIFDSNANARRRQVKMSIGAKGNRNED